MSETDNFTPTGYGVEYDLEAYAKHQVAEQKRLDKLNNAKIELMRRQAYDKERKRDARKDNIKTALWVALILGIVSAAVFGFCALYQHSYKESAKMWLAWMHQCDVAGGKPVGERYNLVCVFPNSELPIGLGEYSESRGYDKKWAPVWVESCNKAGGRAAGQAAAMTCVFTTGAQLPYGEFGT